MKRVAISLSMIAEYPNLALAAYRAARGKRARRDVAAFFTGFDASLARLRAGLLDGQLPSGHFRHFTIHDPKRRIIHAAPFDDRVIHHAIMRPAGPVLERAMTDNSYACRPGFGIHRALGRVQQGLRRHPWYVRIDIQHYFDAIDHELLKACLARRFKGREFTALLSRIIDSYHVSPAHGLPIGALTSQYFANYFLDRFDRQLLARRAVRAAVRYMDDILWWCDSREAARETLAAVREELAVDFHLKVKADSQINRSAHGVSWCGYRILPGCIRLSRRKQRRYRQKRARYERLYAEGHIDTRQLQAAYDAVLAITAHTDSLHWRQKELQRNPPRVYES